MWQRTSLIGPEWALSLMLVGAKRLLRAGGLSLLLAGTVGLCLAPAALAQGPGVAQTCTTPTTGTATAPNRPCWVPGIYSGDYTGTSDTDYYTQAAGHPYEGVTDFTVANTNGVPDDDITGVRVDIPPGLISDPQATPRCTSAEFPSCPTSTQLGVVQMELYTAGTDQWFGASVYNMSPPAGKVSDYAFNIPVVNVRTDVIGGIRSASDDGLYFTIAVPSSVLPAELVRSALIFWGVPGDSAHTPDLGWSCAGTLDLSDPECTPPPSGTTYDLSGTPFLTLPSGCLPAGQVSTLTLTDSSGAVGRATGATPVPATGCASVRFDPSITLTPSTTRSDSPAGVRVDLHVPQDENPNDLATSDLKTAVVTLPPGMTLDPSAANGLSACSPAQFGLGSDAAPTCPAGSRLGTVEIDTPVLPNPLTGTVYLGCDRSSSATPCAPATPGGPLVASLYLYATAPGQGLDQKLVGTVSTNPSTGKVTTTFANEPQVPFNDLILNLGGGPTAAIANPLQCGRAVTTTSIAPYSGTAAAAPTSTFTVDANGAGAACAKPTAFAPGFSVSAGTFAAGAFDDPFTATITRAAEQQYLGRISLQLPPGLVGILASVPECPGPQAADGDCPSASRIGTSSVLAGAGTDPISQSGPVYLTGPYAGAPFGLSIVVPAVAGPFDLGTALVRAAIEVDRTDAHISVVSDPLPQLVGGVPLRLQRVSVSIDRSGFMLNPTSCAPLAIGATITSTQGASAAGTSPFQATGCGALGFSPALRVALSGNRQTTAGGHPTLTAAITSSLGQSNLRSASVTLPLSLALDPRNSANVCSVAASDSDSCSADTAVGTARVITPLLSQPLTGTVYLVQGIRTAPNGQQLRTLPALLIPLRGGGVAIDLRGQTSVDSRSRLVTKFPSAPDVPFSSFALTINGGGHGILVVTGNANLCKGQPTALAAFGSQSGATKGLAVTIGVPCAKRAIVERVRVVGHKVRVLVRVPSAGRLRVGGAGLATVSRRIRQARVVALTLRLSGRGAARLHRRRNLKMRILIRFTPSGWPTQTITTRAITIT